MYVVWRSLIFTFIFNLGFIISSFAANSVKYNLSTGFLNVNYSGDADGTLNFGSIFDVGGEVVTDPYSSLTFHGTIAIDPGTAVTNYMYAGLGKRFYFNSVTEERIFSNGADKIQITPLRQYHFTAEVGMAELNVRTVGLSLFTMATIFEFGFSVGTNWILSNNVSISGSLGMAQGFGFSSIILNDTAIKAFIGLNIL